MTGIGSVSWFRVETASECEGRICRPRRGRRTAGPGLLAALKRDADTPPRKLKGKKYMSTSLVIIDEVGFQELSRQEAALLFRLVRCRYQKCSTIITTNNSVKDCPTARKVVSLDNSRGMVSMDLGAKPQTVELRHEGWHVSRGDLDPTEEEFGVGIQTLVHLSPD